MSIDVGEEVKKLLGGLNWAQFGGFMQSGLN